MLPREKYLKRGIDNLTDVDLIAILIGSGIKGKNFLSVSRGVVNSIRKVVKSKQELKVKDITKVEGVGDITAMKILSGIELGRRLYGLNDKEKIVVRNSTEAYELLKDISKKKQEYIISLFLNSRFELLDKRVICIGSLDGVSVLPRDIIIPALELNASSIIMAHNHPSGDATPSKEDIDITDRIRESLELVGLNLLDHIVIGQDEWKSI
ncbi:MAG: DNA repair protein RadC [Candidatus Dojkabacteria bacterium]